jgi:hypothetical protein
MSASLDWMQVRDKAVAATRRMAADATHRHGVLYEGPMVYCLCGREFHAHRIDTKQGGTDDGQCSGFVAVVVAWQEMRYIKVDLDSGAVTFGSGE